MPTRTWLRLSKCTVPSVWEEFSGGMAWPITPRHRTPGTWDDRLLISLVIMVIVQLTGLAAAVAAYLHHHIISRWVTAGQNREIWASFKKSAQSLDRSTFQSLRIKQVLLLPMVATVMIDEVQSLQNHLNLKILEVRVGIKHFSIHVAHFCTGEGNGGIMRCSLR